jgi:multidrug efflux pump subunit AcrA (membrane-fusion protein)
MIAGCSAKGAAEAEPDGAANEAEDAAVTVTVQPVLRRVGMVGIEGLGRCEAIPDRMATLTPAVEGHVHKLLARLGQTVKAGQPIVELDRQVAEADLVEKTATRDGLDAALALLKSLPREEEQTPHKLAIEQARIAVARAKAIADKLHPLLKRHEVSEQQVFDADQALATAELAQETAESQLHVLLIGPRPEAIAEAEARIKTAEGAVEFSKAHLDFHTIRAPIDGVLDSLAAHPGQTISIGAMIGEVVDTREVFASVWLPQSAALRIKVGQKARVFSAEGRLGGVAVSTDAGLPGVVDSVGRVADPQTGNLPVRVLVKNEDGRLAVGQTIRVVLTDNSGTATLQVPESAVVDLGEGPMLNVVREGKSVTLHPQTAPAGEGWVTVTETDLKEGEPVIVEGGYNLPEGTVVKIAPTKTASASAAGHASKPEPKS